MNATLKRDERDSDMFHFYNKTKHYCFHIFAMHVDSLDIFGDKFIGDAISLAKGEEVEICLSCDMKDVEDV